MPTLGEFIAHAKRFGFKKHTIRDPDLGRITFLRRDRKPEPDLVDLPPMPEGQRLTRARLEALCAVSGIPKEDFGL